MLKILHCADIHARDKDIEEIEKCLDFILDTAGKKNVGLAEIVGDIFDSRDVKLDSKSAKLIIKFVSELADICPVAITIGTPSHEGNAPEILRYAQGKHKIFVATKPCQTYLADGEIDDDPKDITAPQDIQAILSFCPQPTKQYFSGVGGVASTSEQIGAAMSGIFAGFGVGAKKFDCVHLLSYHGSISGVKLSTGQVMAGMDIEVSLDQLALSNADLIMCGHIHLQQELTENVFYSGSIYPNNYGELHEHGFYVHMLEDKRLISSKFIKTPCRKLELLVSDYTLRPFAGVAIQAFTNGSYIRHNITCWQEDAVKINKDEIKQAYIAAGAIDADIRITRVPRQAVRAESVLKVERLRDKIQAMADLREEKISEEILKKADELDGLV
jgi:DNA repair exonuclease SbcCD nuclease subunit